MRILVIWRCSTRPRRQLPSVSSLTNSLDLRGRQALSRWPRKSAWMQASIFRKEQINAYQFGISFRASRPGTLGWLQITLVTIATTSAAFQIRVLKMQFDCPYEAQSILFSETGLDQIFSRQQTPPFPCQPCFLTMLHWAVFDCGCRQQLGTGRFKGNLFWMYPIFLCAVHKILVATQYIRVLPTLHVVLLSILNPL